MKQVLNATKKYNYPDIQKHMLINLSAKLARLSFNVVSRIQGCIKECPFVNQNSCNCIVNIAGPLTSVPVKQPTPAGDNQER
jgi:hypothetical protein